MTLRSGSSRGELCRSSTAHALYGVWHIAEPVAFMFDCPVYCSTVFLSVVLKFDPP